VNVAKPVVSARSVASRTRNDSGGRRETETRSRGARAPPPRRRRRSPIAPGRVVDPEQGRARTRARPWPHRGRSLRRRAAARPQAHEERRTHGRRGQPSTMAIADPRGPGGPASGARPNRRAVDDRERGARDRVRSRSEPAVMTGGDLLPRSQRPIASEPTAMPPIVAASVTAPLRSLPSASVDSAPTAPPSRARLLRRATRAEGGSPRTPSLPESRVLLLASRAVTDLDDEHRTASRPHSRVGCPSSPSGLPAAAGVSRRSSQAALASALVFRRSIRVGPEASVWIYPAPSAPRSISARRFGPSAGSSSAAKEPLLLHLAGRFASTTGRSTEDVASPGPLYMVA
jgi:hypothetical protein